MSNTTVTVVETNESIAVSGQTVTSIVQVGQGPTGLTGAAGSTGPTGPAGLGWKNAGWVSGTSYLTNDALTYNGQSYRAKNNINTSVVAPDVDTTNWALIAAQGSVGATGAAGNPQTIEAAGSAVPVRQKLNFLGDAVTVADSSGTNETNVSINALSVVQDEGTGLTHRPTVNLIGSGVVAVDNPGSSRTDITIPGFLGTVPLVAKTTTYTLTGTDSIVLASATSGAFTLTLPTAVGVTGRMYFIKRTSTNTNNVTVATTSSQTIDGNLTVVLTSPFDSVTVVSDGANWVIV